MTPKDHATFNASSLKLGLLYFVLVFGMGFILGPIRILWLVPKVGNRTAELLEVPLMIVVILFTARWIIRRFEVPPVLSSRLVIGVFALILLLAAELGVAVALRGLSIREAVTNRDPVSGTVYLISLVIFALMPTLIRGDYTAGRT